MDIILIPGLWLDAESWGEVVPTLEAAGHTVHALTMPGVGAEASDSSGMVGNWGPYGDEFGGIKNAEVVKLDTAHWPQFTQPERLANAILKAAENAEER